MFKAAKRLIKTSATRNYLDAGICPNATGYPLTGLQSLLQHAIIHIKIINIYQ